MLVNPLLIMQIPSRYLFVALLRCNDMLEQIPAVGTFNRDYIHMSTFTLWQSDALSIFVTHYPNVFIYVNHSFFLVSALSTPGVKVVMTTLNGADRRQYFYVVDLSKSDNLQQIMMRLTILTKTSRVHIQKDLYNSFLTI